MKNTKKLNLDAFKLSAKQDNKKVESLMGGAALANCHVTKTDCCKDFVSEIMKAGDPIGG